MDFDFYSYMQTIAANHPAIVHSEQNNRFYSMTSISGLEEVLTRLLTAKTPAIGINDTLEGKIHDNAGDRRVDRQLYTFYVFGRASLFNHRERKTVTRQIKQIATEISEKIIIDHHSDFNLQSQNGLRHLDIGTITYRTLANLPDGLMAIITSFVVDEPVKSNITWPSP